MNLSEEQKIEKFAKECGNCLQITFVPYEYEWTFNSYGYNVIKQKLEFSRIQRKKNKIL